MQCRCTFIINLPFIPLLHANKWGRKFISLCSDQIDISYGCFMIASASHRVTSRALHMPLGLRLSTNVIQRIMYVCIPGFCGRVGHPKFTEQQLLIGHMGCILNSPRSRCMISLPPAAQIWVIGSGTL